MSSTSKSMLILLGFMYCSTCLVLLLKWSSSGPRSQPEVESLTIISWSGHKVAVARAHTAVIHTLSVQNQTRYLVLQRLAAFLRDGDADLLLLLQNLLAVLRVLLQDIPCLLHDVLQVRHLEAKPQPEGALLGFRLC